MVNFNFDYSDLRKNIYNYDFNFGGKNLKFNLLLGNNNVIKSIWADTTASLNEGTIYIGREDDLTIVQYSNEVAVIKDYYSTTFSGTAREALNAADSVDINVNYSE